MRWLPRFTTILIPLSLLLATERDTVATVHPGYLKLISDSLGTPLYVDQVFVGKTPFLQPVPVLPGIHEVSYLPPEIDSPYIKKRLPDAVKRVYVPANDTVTVRFFYDPQTEEIRYLRREKTISGTVGFSLILMIVLLLWRITG
jgi:hypothetical protein